MNFSSGVQNISFPGEIAYVRPVYSKAPIEPVARVKQESYFHKPENLEDLLKNGHKERGSFLDIMA